MNINLAGGLELSEDEVTADTPSSPTYREGVSMWIWDDAGQVGLPRIAVEAVGAKWDSARDATVNLTLPDGRILLAFATEPPYPATDEAGRPTVFGAGPLRFDCVEPFAHWRLAFEGHALETTVEDQVAGRTRVRAWQNQIQILPFAALSPSLSRSRLAWRRRRGSRDPWVEKGSSRAKTDSSSFSPLTAWCASTVGTSRSPEEDCASTAKEETERPPLISLAIAGTRRSSRMGGRSG
jgi:hypothetical protein